MLPPPVDSWEARATMQAAAGNMTGMLPPSNDIA
jgi:hypothetical protein